MSELTIQHTDPYPDRIQDSEKAHVMAFAGHALRTSAARNRAIYKSQNENRTTWDRPADNSYLWSANRDDKKADHVEDWAGILYDHPVSEEYKAWHLNPLERPENSQFEYTPKDMVYLENKAAKIKNTLTQGIGDDPDKFNSEKQTYAKRSTRWNILKKLRDLDKIQPSIERQVDELIKNDSTTIGDLVNFYSSSWHRIVDSRRQVVSNVDAILDDVRTGRATDWVPPAQTPEAE